MKKAKNIYSRCFREYQLSPAMLKKVQDSLLETFLFIKEICDKYKIDYMMSGGSLLGTIRHEGFIPWDDDIDIMMTRKNYEKFVRAFKKEKNSTYLLAEPLKSKDYFYKMPKIYKKDTVYQTIANAGFDKYNMISIDIFVIEYMPDSGLVRKLIGTFYDLAFRFSSVCIDYKYPSPVILKKAAENEEIREYYTFRRRLGAVASHLFGMRFYLRICERIANRKKQTHYYGVPSAISYNREVFPLRVFDELTTGSFCGFEVKIPKDYDTYLTNLYHDYMQIPPESKREIHVAYKVEI